MMQLSHRDKASLSWGFGGPIILIGKVLWSSLLQSGWRVRFKAAASAMLFLGSRNFFSGVQQGLWTETSYLIWQPGLAEPFSWTWREFGSPRLLPLRLLSEEAMFSFQIPVGQWEEVAPGS